MPPIDPIRPEIRNLRDNPIGEIARLAWSSGRDVIPLYFGETDLVTPPFIRDAAKTALDEGHTFYTYALGIEPLRAALKTYLDGLYGLNLAPERVAVPGSSMLSVMMALQCVVRTGDNVVIVAPIWPNIFLAAEAAGAEVRFARLGQSGDGGWTFDLDRIAAACDERTKAIFVCSPGNPTGWVMTREEQRDLLAFARARGLALIADEVYARLVFGANVAPSFLELVEDDEPVFVIGGFSKAWAMTGWRIGWVIGPKSLTRSLATLAGINNTGATVFAQYGALAALTDPRGEELVQEMRQRCADGLTIVRDALTRTDRIGPLKVDGTFYAFLQIRGEHDSHRLACDLVTHAGVGVAPGSAFGPGNEDFIRICFALGKDKMRIAMDRLLSHVAAP